MTGLRPVFEKGSPLTFDTTTVARGGSMVAGIAVEPDPNTGKIRPASANSVTCLGILVTNTTGSDYSTSDTTDAWGNTIVNGITPYPPRAAVAASGVWSLKVTGAVGFGQRVKCGASGTIVPVTTNEVQTVTEGGSGLTSFTLTYSGQTTASIAAAATAAQVRAALEALSNVGTGNVAVTGSAGGPYTVTFGGNLAGTDVAQMTATPTGGTGTVTVATTTAGGTSSITAGQVIGQCVHIGGIADGGTGRIRLGVTV